MTDQDLLSDYRHGSDSAFTALVGRHMGLVYSAAVRQVRSPDFAREVCQAVFLELARNAARLDPDTHLPSWLYVVACRRARDVLRRESRRLRREAEAMAEAGRLDRVDLWASVAPLLDEAMGQLSPADREAIIRRFFENQSFRQIGGALNVSDDSAQKRVARALDKLREMLERRGVVAGAMLLGSALSAHAVENAPSALTAAVAAAVTRPSGGAVGTGVGKLGVTHGLLAGGAVIATVALVFVLREKRDLSDELVTLRRESGTLQQTILRDGERRAKVVEANPVEPPPAASPETRADVLARRIRRIQEHFVATPEEYTPDMRVFLNPTDWVRIVDAYPDLDLYGQDAHREQDAILRVTDALQQQCVARFRPILDKAVAKYQSATGRKLPENIQGLLPYFESPLDPALLSHYSIGPNRIQWRGGGKYAPGSWWGY